MAKTLKTYITNLGFFELALAAPSMKAALEAWGLGHNAFHQGFARETHDARIVAATMAKPGLVLKRPVGSKGAFTENAALPKDWSISADAELPNLKKPKAEKPEKKSRKTEKAGRAAIISFEKEKARREKERERQAARDEAREEKDRVQRERAMEKAQGALDRAEARHQEAMAAIEKERDKLDRRARILRERWDEERKELNRARDQARD
jgi:colicin import membrane protein